MSAHRGAHERLLAQLREQLPPALYRLLAGLLVPLDLHLAVAEAVAVEEVDEEGALRLREQMTGRRVLELYRELLDQVDELAGDDQAEPAADDPKSATRGCDEGAVEPAPAGQSWTDAEVEEVAGREILDEGAVAQAAPERHHTERWVLSAAGDGWSTVLPEGARILTCGDELRRDAVELADGTVLYRSEPAPFGSGRWYVRGWSYASLSRLSRDVPLSRQREGGSVVLPADKAGWLIDTLLSWGSSLLGATSDNGHAAVTVRISLHGLQNLAGLGTRPGEDGHLSGGRLTIGGAEHPVVGMQQVHDGDHLGWS